VVVLDAKATTMQNSVNSGDLLTLDISPVRLDWFSSMACYLQFRWAFDTFDFYFISTEKTYF